MSPDDPSHGTISGYKYHGCRCTRCRAATVRYEKGRLWLIHQGLVPTLPARGFKRRVHSLMAIGWTQKEIAAELGVAQGNLAQKLRLNVTVRRATHVRMAEVYERLCMTPRTSMVARRTASIASRRGWPSPLAWDDIDSDPTPTGHRTRHDDRDYDSAHIVDEATVLRILAGENLPANQAERFEVMRRWLAMGNSEASLCKRTGWKDSRYVTRAKGAA